MHVNDWFAKKTGESRTNFVPAKAKSTDGASTKLVRDENAVFCLNQSMHIKNIEKIEKTIVVSILMSSLLFFAVSMNVTANNISPESVLRELNDARTSFGLNLLVRNEQLSKAAQAKLDDMIANNYFEHTSPDGVKPWDWMNKSGYVYTVAGENLAMDFRTAEEQEEAWMESPTHRKNILNSNFQEVGVAVGQGMINGRLTTISVQEFGSRKDFAMLPQENDGTGAEQLNGKILGVQTSSMPSKLSAIFTNGINATFAVGAISGWTMLLFSIAAALMGASAVYLAFDIHKIHKDMRLARREHHQNVYHVSDEDYIHITNSLLNKSLHHHS